MELIRQFGLILAVLGALAAAIAVMRKRGANVKWPHMSRKVRRLEVVERLVLSPQANLVLIRLDEREILIATSGTGCSVLEERKMASGAAA